MHPGSFPHFSSFAPEVDKVVSPPVYMLNTNGLTKTWEKITQAQMEKTKGELIGEFHNKIVTTTIKELSPDGVRMEVNIEGEIKGKLNANSIDTTNLLFKTDGTYEYETKSVATTTEGDTVVLWGSGKGRSTGPMTASFEGEVHYMTQSPRLTWLNNTTALTEGTVDRISREIQGKSYKK